MGSKTGVLTCWSRLFFQLLQIRLTQYGLRVTFVTVVERRTPYERDRNHPIEPIHSGKHMQKAVKKLHPNEKKAADKLVRNIAEAPEKGDRKKGNLSGVYTRTCGLHGTPCRLAYRFDKDTIELIALGSRENFYR